MKKQWLSIVLVLCMVLCMVPTTALAAESKTCELKITVGVNGLTGSAEGATFTFQIKKAINEVTAQYYEYGTMTVTVGADGTTGTNTIAVEEGKYIVQQVGPGDPIGEMYGTAFLIRAATTKAARRACMATVTAPNSRYTTPIDQRARQR